MLHLINFFVQWATNNQAPRVYLSWWLDAIVTIASITFIIVCVHYADKYSNQAQEREWAIDKLIESHKGNKK